MAVRRLGVLTSGGDAPGMNAAIRAVVRSSHYYGLEPVGVMRGFHGLMEGTFKDLDLASVGDIIHRGGTILRTARTEAFKTAAGRSRAIHHIEAAGLDALVVIGGDGSLRGSLELCRAGLPVIGIPGTIDNDVAGTQRSIGFDTAVNTVLEAVSRIRDTASSHERTFVVEVMGRKSGFIALAAGLAGGAESVLIPEFPVDYDDVCGRLQQGFERGKAHSIIIVAEGAAGGYEAAAEIEGRTGLETRVIVLGHVQRGGMPTASDCILGTRLGVAAVDMLRSGEGGRMVGILDDDVIAVSLADAVGQQPSPPVEWMRVAAMLGI